MMHSTDRVVQVWTTNRKHNPALHFKSIALLGEVTNSEVSGGICCASHRINHPIGFLPHFSITTKLDAPLVAFRGRLAKQHLHFL